jgi:uncharacterized repeat protein (TIGR01451 family)
LLGQSIAQVGSVTHTISGRAPNAIAIGFDDTQAFVTQYTNRTITVLDQETMISVTGSPLTPPWADLDLDPDGQTGAGALSGIAMGDGPFFYVANEAGQTADDKSTYGRIDADSRVPGSEPFFTDATHDDNEPVLRVAWPDGDPPIVKCLSSDGNWHPDNVGIQCSASDVRSGLQDAAANAAFVLWTAVASGAGTANALTGSREVCDTEGNCATAGPIGGNKVDKKAPDIAITSPTANAAYVLKQAVGADYDCADDGSGVAWCAGTVPAGSLIDTASLGTKTFTVRSGDATGNTAAVTVSYSVTAPSGGTTLSTNLAISMSAPNKVTTGVLLSYSIIVKNLGSDEATAVKVVDSIPADTTFLSASTSQGSLTTPAVGEGGTHSKPGCHR